MLIIWPCWCIDTDFPCKWVRYPRPTREETSEYPSHHVMIVSNISNMRVTVFTQNQTPRINRVEHTTRRGPFMTNPSRVLDIVLNTVWNVWKYFSNKTILEGEMKDKKLGVSHLISMTQFHIKYLWVWKCYVRTMRLPPANTQITEISIFGKLRLTKNLTNQSPWKTWRISIVPSSI